MSPPNISHNSVEHTDNIRNSDRLTDSTTSESPTTIAHGEPTKDEDAPAAANTSGMVEKLSVAANLGQDDESEANKDESAQVSGGAATVQDRHGLAELMEPVDGENVMPAPGVSEREPTTPKSVADGLSSMDIGSSSDTPSESRNHRMRSPSPPPPPPKDDKYLASAKELPEDPPIEQSQIQHVPATEQNLTGDKRGAESQKEGVDDSRSEIQSIMGQFDEGTEGLGEEEIMSPRLEFAGPLLGSPVAYPPRKSSLEPLRPRTLSGSGSPVSQRTPILSSPPPRTSSLKGPTAEGDFNEKSQEDDAASSRPPSLFRPPPPDPEPDLPFDFHRFLDQLRHRTADPVAKFLRSFLLEFGKRQWMVHEQVKIIGDFLEFISKKMAQCEVWRTVSDAEFDNAKEGMEKLVMNRLYNQTFSPAIPPPEPIGGKNRRKNAASSTLCRKGQHQEDVERDDVLAQKVQIYGWVKEDHLDIKPVGDKGAKFLSLAQKELLKINGYRAPRDKIICVLNCCKVIFGFLRNSQSDQSADSFIPLLIYTVLHANPEHLVSNVQYILRFRNQDKLGGEAGYYISSLMGAVQFIENLDRTSLTVSDDDFEKNVEAAVSAIAEKNLAAEQEEQNRQQMRQQVSPHLAISEKSALSRPEVTPRNSSEAERVTARRSASFRNTGSSSNNTSANTDPDDENDAVAGLLRTIQKPLSSIGRIFSDDGNNASANQQPQSLGQPASTPQPGSTPRLSPAPQIQRRSSEEQRRPTASSGQPLSAEEAAARQASAEAEEARKISRQEHRVIVETLQGMFPGLDKDVISDVVRAKEGRVGLAVDACLALTG